jgi:hypothetical protein
MIGRKLVKELKEAVAGASSTIHSEHPRPQATVCDE